MNEVLSLEKIITRSQEAFRELTKKCEEISEDDFFFQPEEKWSIAQHLQHLIISTKTSTAAFALPKFIVRWVGGKPNRPSRTFEELVEKYKRKLSEGGKAKGRYIPKKISPSLGKNTMINRWEKISGEYLRAIKQHWKNEQLDQYIVPHPLLGKITLRELGYFTIYHTYHHMVSFRNL